MLQDLITSLRAIVATIIVCAVLYPLALLVFAMAAAPQQRMGSLVKDETGKVIGSRLLAQAFTQPQYFWPRPSAVDYNASAAGGSNLSPTNPLIRERAEEIIARTESSPGTKLPPDLVTASGAGLDPHITLTGALVQVPRVARARNLKQEQLQQFVEQVAKEQLAGPPSGEALINVLLLNIATNREFPATTPTP